MKFRNGKKVLKVLTGAAAADNFVEKSTKPTRKQMIARRKARQ